MARRNLAGAPPKLFPVPFLIIIATALAVISPFFFLGNASGHDFEFHVLSWMETVNQWGQGILYPRWAALAHWTYGEARFLFYPPASWNVGAILGVLLPWKIAPGAYVWLVLSASGCTMFLLTRGWLNLRDAIFAAVLYAANPYYIVVVYWRSALAELLAGCLLPLLILVVLRAEEDGPRLIPPLTLIIAAAWLTNAPSAVVVNYSLAVLIAGAAIMLRKRLLLLYGGVAVVLGAGLAGFYLIPAAYEEKWVNIAEVLAPGLRPHDNFFFTMINEVDHNRFNLLVSCVGVAEVLAVIAMMFLSRKQNSSSLWKLCFAWGSTAVLLMLPVTSLLWTYLPELRFVQLPWRWLLCLNVPFAVLATIGLRRWVSRALLCAGMFAVLWIVWHRVQPPWWDTAADIQELHDFITDGDGYEGTDEYVPKGVDPYELKKDVPKVATMSGDPLLLKIDQWHAQSKVFSVEVRRSETLRLRLLNYPAWRVEVNGWSVLTTTRTITGELLVPVSAGVNRVTVRFVQTRDRFFGGCVSILSLVIFGLVVFYLRRPRADQPQPSPQAV